MHYTFSAFIFHYEINRNPLFPAFINELLLLITDYYKNKH